MEIYSTFLNHYSYLLDQLVTVPFTTPIGLRLFSPKPQEEEESATILTKCSVYNKQIES